MSFKRMSVKVVFVIMWVERHGCVDYVNVDNPSKFES